MEKKPYKDRIPPRAAWITYDFANTIFSAVMVTFFFTRYIRNLTDSDTLVGVGNTASMILAGILVPVFSTASDRTGRTKRYLVLATFACCAASAAITFVPGETSLAWSMIALFAVANFFFQAALVFYNTLLSDVARPEKTGLVSGLGVGLGYMGTVFALFALLPVATSEALGMRYTFAGSAILFIVFSIPLFIFVRERPVENPEPLSVDLARRSLKELFSTLRKLPGNRPLLLFLLANFLCVDALNTLVIFTPVTIEGFFPAYKDPEYAQSFVIIIVLLNSCALVAGIVLGKLSDVLGSLSMYRFAAAIFVAALLACMAIGDSSELAFMAVLILCGGTALAGIWTAGRKLLLELAPEGKEGEFFGLYAVTIKVSVIGALLYGVVRDLTGTYEASILFLLVLLIPGNILLWMLKVPRRKKA